MDDNPRRDCSCSDCRSLAGRSGPTQVLLFDPHGQGHFASVENNHTEFVDVVAFTVTERRMIVDGNASTVPPGPVEDFGLLDCRDGKAVASRLRVLVSMEGEAGYEIEEFVELTEGDCGDGGAPCFTSRLLDGRGLLLKRGGEDPPRQAYIYEPDEVLELCAREVGKGLDRPREG